MEKKLTWDDLVAVDLAEPQKEKTIEKRRDERVEQIAEQIKLLKNEPSEAEPWFMQQNGVWMATVKYSTRRLLVKGKKAIKGGPDKESLIPIYEALKEGVKGGMLDTQILDAAAARKKNKAVK